MKYKWEKKYLYWGITAFIVLACAILFYNSIYKLQSLVSAFRTVTTILMPVIYGCVIAFLLTPIVNFIEKKILHPIYRKFNLKESEKLNKISRTIAIFAALLLMVFLIYGLLNMLIPQLIASISTFITSAPTYYDNFQNWILQFMANNPILEEYFVDAAEYLIQYLNQLLPQVKVFLTQISSGLIDVFVVLKNVVIGVIISIYLMSSKEMFTGQAKKLLYAFFDASKANTIIKSVRFIHKKFSGYFVGQIVDALVVGIVCYIATSIIGTPYNVLISVIIGITNIIPFFGPYIGGIPCTLLILLVNPIQAVYFVIFIFVLQMLDGNIIAPHILGESTDLSSFWIVFAILLMGGLFGIIGMFIGVPIFAVVYAGIAHVINTRLRRKDMSTKSEDYQRLHHVEINQDADKEFIYLSVEEKKIVKPGTSFPAVIGRKIAELIKNLFKKYVLKDKKFNSEKKK